MNVRQKISCLPECEHTQALQIQIHTCTHINTWILLSTLCIILYVFEQDNVPHI